jgi:hypothetical protein
MKDNLLHTDGHALFDSLIDYAALFPPAKRELPVAVRRYASHRDEDHASVLGRFLVPVSRFKTLLALLDRAPSPISEAEPWPISVIATRGSAVDLEVIEMLCAEAPGIGRLESVEIPPVDTRSIVDLDLRISRGVDLFFETPVDDALDARIESIARAGRCAKIRTGGTQPADFPSVDSVARFVDLCVRTKTPFKATAGLHHLVRSTRPLADSTDEVTMHGFLNLLFATGVARVHGAGIDEIRDALGETSPAEFRIEGDSITWRDRTLDGNSIRETRLLFLSFGSCSFAEPTTEIMEWRTARATA